MGIYEKNHLIKSYTSENQTSEALPQIFKEILLDYEPSQLFFAKGPGSFMSIKMAYIFLKTLSITLEIPLYATDGFAFNGQKPIKAMRQFYFVKENGMITTQFFDTPQHDLFTLPSRLDEHLFDKNSEPLYILPAV